MSSEYLYLPLFPLPNVVFYPRTLLPLHVFETRYQKLVASVLSGDRLIGIGLLKPGWEKTYYDAPPVYQVVGMGKIVEHEKLHNGNYNLWLSGLERCEIIHEVQDKPFRVAKVQVLRDTHDGHDPSRTVEARRELIGVARDLAQICPCLAEDLRKAIDEQVYPGALADALAGVVCLDNYEKQCVLSERNLTRRLRLVTVQARRRFALAVAEERVRELRRQQRGVSSAQRQSPPVHPAPEL